MVRFIGLLVGLLSVLAACSTTVSGAPAPNAAAAEQVAKEAAEPLTAQRALGDLPTLDYCSLMDQTVFPSAMGQIAVYPKGSYNYCYFTVLKNNRAAIAVRIGYLENTETLGRLELAIDPQRNPPRGLRVHLSSDDHDDTRCFRYLGFPDGLWLTVSATDPTERNRDLCSVTNSTLDIVINRVVTKKARHYRFEDNSFGRIDACGLVPADVVGAAIGAAGSTPLRFPSGHECHWIGSGPVARLFITPGSSTFDALKTQNTTIAGLRTMVTPKTFDDFAMCQIETETMSDRQQPVAEFVLIEVVVVGKDNDACQPARRLAEETWKRLPR